MCQADDLHTLCKSITDPHPQRLCAAGFSISGGCDGQPKKNYGRKAVEEYEQAVEKMQDEIQQEWEKIGPVVEKAAKIMQDLAEKERSAAVYIRPLPAPPVTVIHHHYHERQTQLENIDQEKEELPIPEGETGQTGAELPDTPPILGRNGATWDDTFDWYYRIPKGKCDTLRELASLIMMEYGTVRKEHSKYVKQYGKQPMPKNE